MAINTNSLECEKTEVKMSNCPSQSNDWGVSAACQRAKKGINGETSGGELSTHSYHLTLSYWDAWSRTTTAEKDLQTGCDRRLNLTRCVSTGTPKHVEGLVDQVKVDQGWPSQGWPRLTKSRTPQPSWHHHLGQEKRPGQSVKFWKMHKNNLQNAMKCGQWIVNFWQTPI